MRAALAAGAALTALAAPLYGQAGVRTVTLDEAVALSVRSQPSMVAARQDVRVAEAQQRQAFGAWLPTLSFNSNTNKSGATRLNQNTGQPQQFPSLYSSSFGFSTSWDVFTGFRRGAVRRQSEANTALADATLLRQEYATALATKQTFFQTLAFAELMRVQETRLRSADEQLKLTSERLRLGATTRSDSLRARVEYGQAQLALIEAQNNLRTAQANLGRAIQIEGLVMGVYDSTLEARPASIDTAALRRDARATAPSIRQAEASVTSTRAATSAARSSYWPTASFSAGWSKIGADSVPYGGRYLESWNFRLGLSLPIFNGFTRETNVISADANYRDAAARERDAHLELDALLTQNFYALEAAAARIDVSRVSVTAAQEDLRMQRERYRLGAVTIIEVLASQGNLDQAEVDLVQARYDYLVARASIEALVGHSL